MKTHRKLNFNVKIDEEKAIIISIPEKVISIIRSDGIPRNLKWILVSSIL
jgi:hypothetical protein